MRNKTKWKQLAAFILTAALLVPTQAVYAADGIEAEAGMGAYTKNRAANENGFDIKDGVLTKYTGTATEVVIPDNVTSIGATAFYKHEEITSITIPESVTSIQNNAFSYCSGLTSITIPASVTSIEIGTFSGCSALTSIKVAEGNPNYDSRENCNAIIDKESNTLVQGCMNTTIPEGVVTIADVAFSGCIGLESITIPASVTEIGTNVFFGCNNLASIKVEKGNLKYDSRENCNAIIETKSNTLLHGFKNTMFPASVTSIGNNAFSGCSGLENITIPTSITAIGSEAFLSCSNLRSITLPPNITNIGYHMFANCSALESITIPPNATNIGYYAFYRCTGLTSINIPGSVTNIESGAFAGCSALESITIPASVTNVGQEEGSVFRGCVGLASITVEEGNPKYDSRENCNAIIDKKTNTLVYGCKNTVIPESVAHIAAIAFVECRGLTSIIIPKGVEDIGGFAFEDCSNLTSITIPSSVTAIGQGAFWNHSKELTIYGTAGSYADTYAKQNNIKFSPITEEPPQPQPQPAEKKTITAKDATITPTSYTYNGKAKKPAVTVKVDGTTLKNGTDYTVSYKNNINAGTAKAIITGKGNYQGTVTKTFTITIRKGTSHTVGAYKYQVTASGKVTLTGTQNKKATKVKVPKTVKIGGKNFKVTALGKNAFRKNTKITSVEIGDNVKIIGISAFEGCTRLTKATIGKGVSEISRNAFKGCRKLGSITIKSSTLKKVGSNALKGIKSTARIKVPKKKLSSYQKLFWNKGQGKKVKIIR